MISPRLFSMINSSYQWFSFINPNNAEKAGTAKNRKKLASPLKCGVMWNSIRQDAFFQSIFFYK